jgi:hypothetical protein
MHRPHRSDRSTRGLVRLLDRTAARRHRQDPESGQATTEFALILFPLVLLVGGIIYWGIALNYWLDMNRLTNQGARWAVVNAYPGCTKTQPNTLSCGGTISLQRYIACQPLPTALKPTVDISFPAGTADRGDPVQVTLSTPFKFIPIVGFKNILLKAKATMRLEQTPKRFTSGSYTATGCP